MKISNPTKSSVMPLRWNNATMTRSCYQAKAGATEVTGQLPTGLYVHVTLTDVELDALVRERELARMQSVSGATGHGESTHYGASYVSLDGTVLLDENKPWSPK